MLAGVLGASGQAKHAGVLRVAAASDLQPVMPAIAYAYEKKTGVKLEVTFGSSSVLAAQIEGGAPIDVFLGADFLFPEKVIAAGLAVEKLPVDYAMGALVLWTRKDTGITPTMESLTDARVLKIAVADEFRAPYGRAAYTAMRYLKLGDKLKGKLVVAEDLAQAGQLAESGKAQVAFISLSMAMSGKMKAAGTFVRVPAVAYPKIVQTAVVMKKGRADEGKEFLDWMRGSEVQTHLADFGLTAVR